jgi:hypothetical protein
MSLALTTTHENAIFGGVSLHFLRVITNAYGIRAEFSGARNFSQSPNKPAMSLSRDNWLSMAGVPFLTFNCIQIGLYV